MNHGVGYRHYSVPAPIAGALIVVLRDEVVKGCRQVLGESGPLSWRSEPNLGVQGEGGQALLPAGSALDQLAHLGEHPCGDR